MLYRKFSVRPINNPPSNLFADCLNYCHLVDLGFIGCKYTWTNKRQYCCNVLERLDGILATYDWLNLFPEASVRHLPRTHPHHNPLLLSFHSQHTPTNKPFRFKTIWTSHPEFIHIFFHNWHRPSNLLETIDSFTKYVSEWNKTTFGKLFHRKKYTLARLDGIQSGLNYPTSRFLQNLETNLLQDYNAILRQEEEF